MSAKVVIMGVAGCGKTSVGEGLQMLTGVPFLDGDTLHPKTNIEKMASGTPLTDDDRWPWLEAVGRRFAGSPGPLVIGCSALKRAYRDHIIRYAGGPVAFIHLAGTRDEIGRRMKNRSGHFMPVALLDSQFATLEPPGDDENAISIDINQPLETIVAAAAEFLGGVRDE